MFVINFQVNSPYFAFLVTGYLLLSGCLVPYHSFVEVNFDSLVLVPLWCLRPLCACHGRLPTLSNWSRFNFTKRLMTLKVYYSGLLIGFIHRPKSQSCFLLLFCPTQVAKFAILNSHFANSSLSIFALTFPDLTGEILLDLLKLWFSLLLMRLMTSTFRLNLHYLLPFSFSNSKSSKWFLTYHSRSITQHYSHLLLDLN